MSTSYAKASGTLAVLTVALLAWTSGPTRPTSPRPPVQYTGVVTAWHISADGAVAMRLTAVAGSEAAMSKTDRENAAADANGDKTSVTKAAGIKVQEGGFQLWFVTPADRTETTRFEELVLDTVLQIAGGQTVITLTSTGSNEHHGETVDDAIPIGAVHWEK